MNLLDILLPLPRRRREKEELKKLEPEIKNLEEKLGLIGRTNTEVYYDPLYERNRGRIYDLKGRKEYLEESAKIAEKLKRLASRRGHKVDNITYTGMGPAYQNNKIYTSGTKAADVLKSKISK